VVPSVSLVVIERPFKYLQTCATNIVMLIPKCKGSDPAQTEIRHDCYPAAIVMGVVGMVLLVDKEFKMIQMVSCSNSLLQSVETDFSLCGIAFEWRNFCSKARI
jgi:hypothetical protein